MFNRIIRYIRLNILSVFNRHPLYYNEHNQSPFFILSAGRSGSTLLRKILLRSEVVSVPPETQSFIPNITFIYIKYNYLPWDVLVSKLMMQIRSKNYFDFWNIEINETDVVFLKDKLHDKSLQGILGYFYNKYLKKNYPNSNLWGDKTPLLIYHTDVLQKVFPNAKYIFITRDSRDVVSSFMNNKLFFNMDYLCERWILSIRVRNNLLKNKGSRYVHLLQYENLVKNPQKEVSEICSFLSIPFKDKYLNNTFVYLGDDEQKHFSGTQEDISTDKIGRWKRMLTEEQKETITKQTYTLLKAEGYI